MLLSIVSNVFFFYSTNNCYSFVSIFLFCLKATTFVTSARELFDLMLKLREAKKKLKEEREAATQGQQF